MVLSIESFIAGFAYGGTTVLIGQPMDTIKTLVQVQASSSPSVGGSGINGSGSAKYADGNNNHRRQHPTLTRTVVRDLYSSSGVRGFYRGGTALFVGGGLMRSAQFGVYNSVITTLNNRQGGKTMPSQYWFGCIDPNVVLAGYAGGIGRGLVEGPFEMVKVRRQVVGGWNIRDDVFRGFGTTLFRNSFLFSSFVIYMDIFRREVEEKRQHTVYPGIKAGICANIAWATIWPLDVVKTRRQSGKYDGKSSGWLLRDAFRNGDMYRGLTMGMLRSFIANGVSMEVYTVVERELKCHFTAR